MAWNMHCYGIKGMAESRDDHMSLLAYMAGEAKPIPAYSGHYLNYYMKSVQFCLQAKRTEEKHYDICGSDTHNTDTRVWACKVKSVLKSDRDPLMSKRLLVTSLDDDSMAVIELINADILPNYDEDDIIRFQVIAQGIRAKYYLDEEQYHQAEGFDIKPGHPTLKPGRMSAAMGSLLPFGFLNQHLVREEGKPRPEVDYDEDLLVQVTGIAKAFAVKDVVFEGELMTQYVSCLIDTPFGELPLVHTFDEVPEELRDNLKAGAVVTAVCTLSGDVMIHDYENGIILNTENNLKLFKSAFGGKEQWPRLYPVLDEKCHYNSEGSNKEIIGRDEIIAFLAEREKVQNTPELTYHACYGKLLEPKCDEFLLAHKEGEHVVVLWQGEERSYEAIVFLHNNENGMVDDIYLCKDSRYVFRTYDICPPFEYKPEKNHNYQDLKGQELLQAYFRDHGLRRREIDLLDFWGYFRECHNMIADQRGMKYAYEVTEKMKHYRGLPAEYISKHLDEAPWYWPTAMKFYKLGYEPPVSNEKVWGIMECEYKGKCYLFGIGKDEVTITEDMRKNGNWSIYTYSD